MPTLNCTVTNCAYNSSHYCCLEHIDVSGLVASNKTEDTCCSSFVEKTEGQMSNVSNMCSAEPDANIYCKANSCMYNMGHNCTADAIEIVGQNANHCEQTECSTFSDGSDAFNESLKF
jgi:hypothetical protein